MNIFIQKGLARIFFTVTNDLTYDQRMQRICRSLSNAGHSVVLVGRKRKNSIPLKQEPYRQYRLRCLGDKGFIFYASYNIRLLFFLWKRKMDAICAIDLDTILPCLWVSRIKKIQRIYDAHELFCEMKEIASRPVIYLFWKWIERATVPKFKWGYTVNASIAEEFKRMYNRNYEVIRNVSRHDPIRAGAEKEDYILYQGAVNEGRSFETLIPAMQWVNAKLIICGDGNFMAQTKKLVEDYAVGHRVEFKGMVEPEQLKRITSKARIGITLFEPDAKSNYFSLANRFFDYIHAGVPQVCSDFPVYREINLKYEVATLVADQSAEELAKAINFLLYNSDRWDDMHRACLLAAKELNWETESTKLVHYYNRIFGS